MRGKSRRLTSSLFHLEPTTSQPVKMNNLMIPLSEQSEQDLAFMDAAIVMVRLFSPSVSLPHLILGLSPSSPLPSLANQAEEAFTASEIPVGCVLVHEGRIIAKGRNRTNEGRNATLHAEFDALRHLLPDRSHVVTPQLTRPFTPQEGERKVWETPLEGVVLYVTVEPCIMCAAAMRQVGIEKVIYGCGNDRFGGTGGVQSIHSELVSQLSLAFLIGLLIILSFNDCSTRLLYSPPYPAYGNYRREEAIMLLRRFYLTENTSGTLSSLLLSLLFLADQTLTSDSAETEEQEEPSVERRYRIGFIYTIKLGYTVTSRYASNAITINWLNRNYTDLGIKSEVERLKNVVSAKRLSTISCQNSSLTSRSSLHSGLRFFDSTSSLLYLSPYNFSTTPGGIRGCMWEAAAKFSRSLPSYRSLRRSPYMRPSPVPTSSRSHSPSLFDRDRLNALDQVWLTTKMNRKFSFLVLPRALTQSTIMAHIVRYSKQSDRDTSTPKADIQRTQRRNFSRLPARQSTIITPCSMSFILSVKMRKMRWII